MYSTGCVRLSVRLFTLYLLNQQILYIECYSETSVNCVLMFYCYFVSTVYSSLDVFYITKFMFVFTLHSMLHVRLSYVY